MAKQQPTCNWIKNNEFEVIFAQLPKDARRKSKLEFKKFPMNKLKIKESKSNNARFDTELVPSHVENVAQSMADNWPIHSIVITPDGRILAGNHRVGAAELNGYTYVMAHVVLGGDEKLYRLIERTSNVSHGMNLPDADRVKQASYLVISCGHTCQEAAELMRCRPGEVSICVSADRLKDELQDAGVDVVRLHKEHLSTIVKSRSPKVRRAIAKTVVSQHLTTKQTKELAAKVGAKAGDKLQLEVVKDWRKIVSPPESDRRLQRDKIMNLIANTSGLDNFLSTGNDGKPFRSLDELELNGDKEVAKLKKRWVAARTAMDKLFRNYRNKKSAK